MTADIYSKARETITLGQFLDALKKNGHPWGQSSFWKADGRSCAIGQAIRNLGWDSPEDDSENTYWDYLGWRLNESFSDAVGFSIIYFNDSYVSDGNGDDWKNILGHILDTVKKSKVPHNKILVRKGEILYED